MTSPIDALFAEMREAAITAPAAVTKAHDDGLAAARARSAARRPERLQAFLDHRAALKASIDAHPANGDDGGADVVPLWCPDCGAPTPRGCSKGCGE